MLERENEEPLARKIVYQTPELQPFSYGMMRIVCGATGCEMRYSHTTDCNANLSEDEEDF